MHTPICPAPPVSGAAREHDARPTTHNKESQHELLTVYLRVNRRLLYARPFQGHEPLVRLQSNLRQCPWSLLSSHSMTTKMNTKNFRIPTLKQDIEWRAGLAQEHCTSARACWKMVCAASKLTSQRSLHWLGHVVHPYRALSFSRNTRTNYLRSSLSNSTATILSDLSAYPGNPSTFEHARRSLNQVPHTSLTPHPCSSSHFLIVKPLVKRFHGAL